MLSSHTSGSPAESPDLFKLRAGQLQEYCFSCLSAVLVRCLWREHVREKRRWSQRAVTEEEIIESGTGGKGLEKAVEEMWKEDREEKKKKKRGNTNRILTFCLSFDSISLASQGLASSSGVLLHLGTQSCSPQPPAAPDYWSHICWVIRSNGDIRLGKSTLTFLKVSLYEPQSTPGLFFVHLIICFKLSWHLCRMQRVFLRVCLHLLA